jgi:Phage tail lysozyme
VAKLKSDYQQALGRDWGQAATLLNGFNDDDIRRLLPRNLADLRALRAGALAAMPGWSDRVTRPIDLRLRDPWPLMRVQERVVYAMNLLVGTHGYPVNGAAGIVGNLNAESGVLPSRIEGSAPDTPMRARNFAGKVTDFTPDEIMNRSASAGTGPRLPGVGLAQWTAAGRRSGLFTPGSGILFDMDAQIAFLVNELPGYPALNASLTAPGVTPESASDDFVYQFEVPASILDADRHLLPRTDPAVQATFAARRRLARHALDAYRAVHPAPVPASGP